MSAIALPSSDISIHALRGEGDNRPDRQHTNAQVYFNPRPPWGGRPTKNTNERANNTISIHALRGEGDARRSYHGNDNYNFNPRPPWGGRLLGFFMRTRLKIFQSTPSVGRATVFYRTHRRKLVISIHALRGEGDKGKSAHCVRDKQNFNPRPPWGGRQNKIYN